MNVLAGLGHGLLFLAFDREAGRPRPRPGLLAMVVATALLLAVHGWLASGDWLRVATGHSVSLSGAPTGGGMVLTPAAVTPAPAKER